MIQLLPGEAYGVTKSKKTLHIQSWWKTEVIHKGERAVSECGRYLLIPTESQKKRLAEKSKLCGDCAKSQGARGE